MASAAEARKKAAAEKRRVELTVELLDINIKHAVPLARADELKTELKQIATDTANFQQVIANKGKVSVSGMQDERFVGTVPEIVAEVFNALPKKEQEQLIKRGLVKRTDKYAKAYYGQVKVTVFPGATAG